MDEQDVSLCNKKCKTTFSGEQWLMICFLISKGEHDNEKPERTFKTHDGGSVWTYASALPYDWRERGVTTSFLGHTTHNSGKAAWGDAYPLFHKFHKMGGPDLAPEARTCNESKKKADAFATRIQTLDARDAERYATAGIKVMVSKKNYLRKSIQALRDLGIEPRALSVATVWDTAMNQGIGGKWCPVAWLSTHGVKGDEDETMKQFNHWRRDAAQKNHHNSPPSNGAARSDMFESLRRDGRWDLPRKACEEAVGWRMR
ncbi:MAG: hypothetical protein ACO35C_05350 [Pontimonas sp.]